MVVCAMSLVCCAPVFLFLSRCICPPNRRATFAEVTLQKCNCPVKVAVSIHSDHPCGYEILAAGNLSCWPGHHSHLLRLARRLTTFEKCCRNDSCDIFLVANINFEVPNADVRVASKVNTRRSVFVSLSIAFQKRLTDSQCYAHFEMIYHQSCRVLFVAFIEFPLLFTSLAFFEVGFTVSFTNSSLDDWSRETIKILGSSQEVTANARKRCGILF